jgi:dephospho-CoA kinase
MTLTIGLTGGFGSGKTTVGRILAELGAKVIDADKVGHAIYEPGTQAHREVVAAFGPGVLEPGGAIDRKKLAAIVFADPAALSRLNAIVHPRMFERMRQMVGEIRSSSERNPIVIEAAVLIEANWQPLCDEIWLVTASRERVLERLGRDRALDRAQIEARMNAQMPDAERPKHATHVLINDGTVEELRAKTVALWNQVTQQSR